MKGIKRIRWLCAALCFAASMSFAVQAAQQFSVMNGYTQEDSLILYIKDEGREIQQVYIGNESAEDFSLGPAGESRTIVLVDNSLSISTKYRDDIKQFLADLVAARGSGDLFTIATFSEDTHYLVKDSGDYLEVKAQIDQLSFVNQDTYLNKILYQVLDDLEQEEGNRYTRIIMIADGIDNEKLGYTQEELEKKIKEVRVPVYTLGCSSKGNEENLKQMFALSRVSNGLSFLMDDSTASDILKTILDDSKVLKLQVFPQDKACDGSRQVVRISFGNDYSQTDMMMPFREMEEETPESTEQEPETETETEAEEFLQDDNGLKAAEEGRLKLILILAAAGIVGIGSIILVIVVCRKRKRKKAAASADHSEKYKEYTDLDLQFVPEEEERATEMLMPTNTVTLVLQDTKQPAKSFEYPLRDRVIIGKNRKKCQIAIAYDGTISGIHCEIFKRGNRYYVRDVGTNGIASTNGTFVNGRKAAPELELRSGDVLKLGRVSLKVTMKQFS